MTDAECIVALSELVSRREARISKLEAALKEITEAEKHYEDWSDAVNGMIDTARKALTS